MLRVGLTGGIASGKSAVAARLAERGVAIIDADVLAREAVAPGSPGLRAVAERFGSGVLTPGGQLDRAALGRVVFGDAAARADLNAIVHPIVRRLAAEREAAATGDIVVQVIPLLVETGQARDFDEVVVVDVDEATQVERLRSRDHLSAADAEARLAAQASRAERLAAATRVLRNDGTPAQLRERTDALLADLRRGQA